MGVSVAGTSDANHTGMDPNAPPCTERRVPINVPEHRLLKLGGGSLVASGVLFLVSIALGLRAGAPPATGEAILAWAKENEASLAISNELLFFASALLIPAVPALYRSLAGIDRTKVLVGSSLVAALIPVLFVVTIVHGRLVFPVYGIHVGPAAAELVVALFAGGLHAFFMIMAVATVALGLAMRRSGFGASIVYLGFVTAALDLVAAYPWSFEPAVLLVAQLAFSAWFVAVGMKIYCTRGA
jgi:hypothetical protein